MYGNAAHQQSGADYASVRLTPLAEPDPSSIVYVLGSDSSVCQSWAGLVRSAGWSVVIFGSVKDFLARPRSPVPSCLILDAFLPNACCLQLQEDMKREDAGLCTILVMEQPNVSLAVQAIKAGAVEVLCPPVDPCELLDVIDDAIRCSKARLEARSRLETLRERHALLSIREREVMMLIVSGLLNKQVGGELGISEFTVKAHRGQVMRKMEARSFAELVKMAAYLSDVIEAPARKATSQTIVQ